MPRRLVKEEIDVMVRNGCTSSEWELVIVCDGFLPERLKNVVFEGSVQLGRNTGSRMINGIEYPCGITNAVLSETLVGDNVLIWNIGTHIYEYVLEDHVVLMNVAELRTETNAGFGQNTLVEVKTGQGSAPVPLSEHLTAPIAFLLTEFGERTQTIKTLEKLLGDLAMPLKNLKGVVGKGTKIFHSGPILNMRIGAHAVIHGAALLKNGTLQSNKENPIIIEEGVIADSFVVMPGGRISAGAVLGKVFVGQNVCVEKKEAAEGALLFSRKGKGHVEEKPVSSPIEIEDMIREKPLSPSRARVIREYLLHGVMLRIDSLLTLGAEWEDAVRSLEPVEKSEVDWVDAGGIRCPRKALVSLLDDLDAGRFAALSEFNAELDVLRASFPDHEWAYVCGWFREEFKIAPWELTREKVTALRSV